MSESTAAIASLPTSTPRTKKEVKWPLYVGVVVSVGAIAVGAFFHLRRTVRQATLTLKSVHTTGGPCNMIARHLGTCTKDEEIVYHHEFEHDDKPLTLTYHERIGRRGDVVVVEWDADNRIVAWRSKE
jgi:hypothetical protein